MKTELHSEVNMNFLKTSALTLLITGSTFAQDFKPENNHSFEYSAVTIETDAGFKSEADVFSYGYNYYYSNNISSKFIVGMGKGSKTAEVNDVDTGDNARVNYMLSADIRYEFPLTNSLSTYALLGASYVDIETTEDILNEKRSDFGLKLGAGLSYALANSAAIYAEIKQDVYKTDFEVQSYSVGFKFNF